MITALQHRLVAGFIKTARYGLADQEFTEEQQARYQQYRGRRQNEQELWHKWDQGGRKPEHLSPLLKSMQPVVKAETNKRMTGLGGSIPRAALENELQNSAVKSIHTYDPNRGSLSTHVGGGFQRVSDFVNANRNAKYTPGDDVKKYDRYRNVHQELREDLGRDPTAEEMKPHLPWDVKTIKKLQRSFSPEVHTDMGDGLSANDNHAELSHRDAFHLVQPKLTPQEQRFGQMYFPPEGQEQPSIKNIARNLDIPAHKAYRLKARVESQVGGVLRKQ